MSQRQERLFVEREDVLSWGRVVRQKQYVAHPNFRDELPRSIAALEREKQILATGLEAVVRRPCLIGAGAFFDLTGLDRFILLDAQRGSLPAPKPASASPRSLQLVVPHGWFLPTTPGTRFVTLGGERQQRRPRAKSSSTLAPSASMSSPSACPEATGSPPRLRVRDNEQDLFRATIGGLGLTGVHRMGREIRS